MFGRLVFVLLAVAALAGTASAARDPRDPKERHNPADQAWAQAIRIQRDDLGPGDWRVEPLDNDDGKAPPDCKDPDLSDLVVTGDTEESVFSREGSFVGSASNVWLNKRHALSAWTRILRTQTLMRKCFTAALRQSSSINVTVLSSGPLRVAKLAPRMLTYRIRFRVKGPAATIAGRMSVYIFSRGRADGSLIVGSFGRPLRPIPESLERRLVAMVAERLKHT